MKEVKKVAVDVRPLSRSSGGIQRYLQMILPHLNDDQYQLILYSDHPLSSDAIKKLGNAKVRHVNLGVLTRLVWPFFVMFWTLVDSPNVFWSPRHHLPFWMKKEVKSIVTIHDLIWITQPQTMRFFHFISEKYLMPRAISRADILICVSNTTKHVLISNFENHAGKCVTILHGEDSFEKDQFEMNTRMNKFLTVGTLEPRKNYESMIKAFALYADRGGKNDLIIVGNRGWSFGSIYDVYEKCLYKSRIDILENVVDDQLNDLYHSVRGFISTSIDEGYGLPLQEAVNAGLPLCISDIAIYKELFSDAALWFNPSMIEEIASAMIELDKLGNATGRQNRSPRLRRSSWLDCALLHKQEIFNAIELSNP